MLEVISRTQAQETILLVEDDVLVRMPLAEYLRDCGYKVIEAVNADEAMTVLKDEKIRVDVVSSGIEMPDFLDGFGLAKWIREHRPGLEVLLAGTLSRSVEHAEQLCDDGPIPKPYHPQMVLNRIRRLLAMRRTA